MTERTFTIHREGIDRFTAIVDGEEVVAVRAADYDAMETARDMLGRELDEAEAELAHIKQFLSPTGWQKAQDEHNALRAQLAEAEDTIERAGRCLVMSNNGAVEALTILRGYKQPDSAPAVEQRLWLWRNGDHFLAFEHLYPCFTPGGDPMTLGEPVGYAIVKRSFDRAAGSASGLWRCECGDVQPTGIPCQCGKTETDQPELGAK
jgi:hypothetical protein